jgi:DNA polymerase zeta
LLNKVIDTIVELDPDIITGWEIQKASWGYVSSRGQTYGKPSGHTGTVQSDLIGTRSRCI